MAKDYKVKFVGVSKEVGSAIVFLENGRQIGFMYSTYLRDYWRAQVESGFMSDNYFDGPLEEADDVVEAGDFKVVYIADVGVWK